MLYHRYKSHVQVMNTNGLILTAEAIYTNLLMLWSYSGELEFKIYAQRATARYCPQGDEPSAMVVSYRAGLVTFISSSRHT
jgi:hypothetical protein